MATKRFTGTIVEPMAMDEQFYFLDPAKGKWDQHFTIDDICDELGVVEGKLYRFTITAVEVR